MNFINLYYFQTLAEEMNFTRAAKRLFISQQSLSGHIARLENDLGVSLLERTPKLRLTYAGECVLESAKTILSCEKQMNSQLYDIINNHSGKLSLGVYLYRSQLFLTRTLPKFLRLYPRTKISLSTGLSSDLEKQLLDGDIELLVGFTPFESMQLEVCHLTTERLCVMIPQEMFERRFLNSRTIASHFEKNGVDLTVIMDFPFLRLEPNNRARVLADRILEALDLTPNILFQTADTQTMLSLCYAGIGCCFVFEQAARDFLVKTGKNKSQVFVFPVMDASATTDFVIAYYRKRYLSNTAKNFIRLAQGAFSNLEEAGAEVDK